jgi:hypothetical protein
MRKHPLLAFATAVSTIPLSLFGTAGTVAAITTHTSSTTQATPATTSAAVGARHARRHRRKAHAATAASRRVRHVITAHVTAQSLLKRGARVRIFVPLGGAWAQLRNCESGGNYTENSGNGYYGAYQFSLSTWNSLGLGGVPSQAAPAAQDAAAVRLQVRAGWRSWPMCSWTLNLS